MSQFHNPKLHEEFQRPVIAIIGGGFSGAMMAVQLLRTARGPIDLMLIENGPLLGRGVAYATAFDGHLLNVRADGMSAYPDVPDHFVKWAQQNYSSSVKADDFLPRRVYGQYVVAQLQDTSASHPGQLQWIRDEAVSLARAGDITRVGLKSGNQVVAHKVILALGNFPPGDLPLFGKTPHSPRYVFNPWSSNKALGENRAKSVLLIGSGLTSVDTAIELGALGFKGTIHILSRRGLLPQGHKVSAPFSPSWGNSFPRTVRGLLRLIRLQVKEAAALGSDWRPVIDSLRPFTHEIWRALPRSEQRRFLRHVRTFWDVHRHRVAERVADQLAMQIQSGQVRMHAGRIAEYREDSSGVELTYRNRKSGRAAKLQVDFVINCTGPEADCRRVNSPLLSDLMDKKLARPDELSLGLDVSDDGAVLDAQGRPSNFLFALGPLRKGSLWETIAVPEIRVQVAELAELLVADFRTEDSESMGLTVPGDPSIPRISSSTEETCSSSNSI
jgi:uncharacterized NAD(P)/FAD-binding protein YdhS